MKAPIPFTIEENTFWISPHRCLFWQEEKALIVSDLHFGKTGHFRKNGIAVPTDLYKEDLQRLMDQISFFKPAKIIAVGDLFHSAANKEMDQFIKWRNDFPLIDFILVKGNHDILSDDWYKNAGIIIREGLYRLQQIGFIHDRAELIMDNLPPFIFSGHLHPGIAVKGMGKQNLRFPCYYFNHQMGILPAFSKFSGIKMMRPKKADTIFAIVDDQIIRV